jgi:hypothetical protein
VGLGKRSLGLIGRWRRLARACHGGVIVFVGEREVWRSGGDQRGYGCGGRAGGGAGMDSGATLMGRNAILGLDDEEAWRVVRQGRVKMIEA